MDCLGLSGIRAYQSPLFFFFVIEYNSHPEKLPQLRGLGVYSQNCQPSPLSNFRTFSSPQKPHTHSAVTPRSPPSSPWQPLIFLSPWIFLFWTLRRSGTIRSVAFCVWLLSFRVMFLEAHPCCIVSLLFMIELITQQSFF